MSLRKNLVSYWSLDEASGPRADSHGGVSLGQTFASVGSASGIISNAAQFDAMATAGILEASHAGYGSTAFSFQAWIKPNTLSAATIFAKGIDFSSGNADWAVLIDASGHVQVEINGSVVLTSSGTVSTGAFAHIVVTSDGSTITIYKNASSIGTVAGAFTPGSTSNDLFMGAKEISGGSGHTSEYDGLIDEAAYWSRKLTGTEVTALYGAGSGLAYSFGYALSFSQQPSNTAAGSNITASPAVEILDETTTRDVSATDSITLAIGTNPASGTLTSATNPLAASSGLATFSGTSINNAGVGYTLTAAATGITGATSSSFNITAASDTLRPQACL